jgi:anti-sigma regulatory factor (Ser/Thr protein kinase)
MPDRVPAAYGTSAHIVAFYDSAAEYAGVVGDFVLSGLAAGIPVMVAVPGDQGRVIQRHLGRDAGRVSFAEMTTVGRNPGRIIPAMRAFADAHPGSAVRYVGEPVWPARTAAACAEAMRHEALLNTAFRDQPLCALCPYDAAGLGSSVLDQAEHTHPMLLRDGRLGSSPVFAGRPGFPGDSSPFPPPPVGTEVLTYREPGIARAFARDRARRAGLREPLLSDLVIAVGELAANTLRHTRGPGLARVWVTPAEVICEIRDSGHITDPLAGRMCPPADSGGGHGLWVVHQVCDLVEMRTNRSGTTFRLHMGLP